jgi:hypothetical protein
MGHGVSTGLGHSIDDAREVVTEYAKARRATWFSDEIVERDAYWFFPVGFIGSVGVIVDKADLALSPMGSALPIDDCFWGHEHGFSPRAVVLRVLAVHDLDWTIEFLLHFAGAPANRNPNPRRAWIRSALARLPYDCPPQNLWLAIPAFRSFEPPEPFDYQLFPSETPAQP